MYEPAGEVNQVGGDFYEVFAVQGGWALVLGDVAGRGAAAAALTAEARHTIRTAGALAAEPVAGLEVLNRNLRLREDVALCSVAMLFLPDVPADDAEVLVYLAGHPHPMHLRDGRAELIGQPGPLLGVADDPDWDAGGCLARAGRAGRALHRRRDRGAAARGRPVRHRPPAGAPRRRRDPRARGRARP